MIKIAFRAIPSVEMGVDVNNGERYLERTNGGKRDAVIPAEHDGNGLPGQDRFDGLGDLGIGLFGNSGIYEDIADIDPMPAFQDGAVAIDVVKALSEIMGIFLRILAEVARTVALPWLAPSALIERNPENGEVGAGGQLRQVRLIGCTEKSTNADKGGSSLA